MRELKRAFILLLVVYICVLALMFTFQRALLYGPSTKTPDPLAYNLPQDVTITVETSDGLRLRGWYISPHDAEKPIILYAHGNVGHVGDRMHKVLHYTSKGYGALMMGYRGYGGNPGAPTEEGLYHDARAYIEWLGVERAIKPQDIVFYGESLGSGVAVQMATEYNFAAVILEAPYSSTAHVAQGRYPFIPVHLLMHDQFRSIDKIKDLNEPLLIVHGLRDAVVPYALGLDLFEQANDPKEIVTLENAAHNDLYDHGMALHVLQFLRTIEKASEEKE